MALFFDNLAVYSLYGGIQRNLMDLEKTEKKEHSGIISLPTFNPS